VPHATLVDSMGAMSRSELSRAVVALGVAALTAVSLSARQALTAHLDGAFTAIDPARAVALRARGQSLGYNLDRDDALASFREAITVDPLHPAAYRLTAATVWINMLFQQGSVTAEDYLGQARSDLKRRPPAAELDAIFREHLGRALTLADQRCRAACSAEAHFQLGAAYGYQATYAATIEGSLFGSLRAARRAYAEHQRVLDLDPARKDAGLIVGMYRYAVSSLSLPSRLMARVAGFGSGRERGLRMVEEAASYPSDVQTNARFTLIVIYNREARFDDALRVIGELQRQYPRNRLLWLEAGSTSLRAGRPADARQSLEHGLAMAANDARPRAFGELARWGYYHGAALVALKESVAARRALDEALRDPSRAWVQGRIHTELGKLADLAADRSSAIEEYRHAVRLCGEGEDDLCVKDARTLMKGGYR
jgi:tetratricopeptide (TPR) repeat protein